MGGVARRLDRDIAEVKPPGQRAVARHGAQRVDHGGADIVEEVHGPRVLLGLRARCITGRPRSTARRARGSGVVQRRLGQAGASVAARSRRTMTMLVAIRPRPEEDARLERLALGAQAPS
jgi:hypothetical protein